MNKTARRSERKGAMLVFVAISMIVFLVCAAFTIDVAYMQLVRTELQAATDAAAKAAVVELSASQDEATARQRGLEIALANHVAGDPLALAGGDLVFGASTEQSNGEWVFAAGQTPLNAVQVNARRTVGSSAGEVQMLFGGINTPQFFEPVQVATATHLERDLVLVLDRSGSMAFDLSGVDWSYPPGGSYCTPPHPTQSRWAALAIATQAFLSELEDTETDEMVGMVTYASPGSWCDNSYQAADTESELTNNYSAVSAALAVRSANAIPGGTSISSGLDLGIQVILGPAARPHAQKTIILMTDGVHNHGPAPISSANSAAAQDITIHTITFSGGADQAQMQQVAAATGGNHYHAPTAAALITIFKAVAHTMPAVLTD